MNETYQSLLKAISPYVDQPFEAMPEEVRQLWLSAYEWVGGAATWDGLGVSGRKSLADQYDIQHDPAFDEFHTAWWELWDRQQKLEAEKDHVELLRTPDFAQYEGKRNRLDELTREIAELEGARNKLTVSDLHSLASVENTSRLQEKESSVSWRKAIKEGWSNMLVHFGGTPPNSREMLGWYKKNDMEGTFKPGGAENEFYWVSDNGKTYGPTRLKTFQNAIAEMKNRGLITTNG
jgi:hypothetical protein